MGFFLFLLGANARLGRICPEHWEKKALLHTYFQPYLSVGSTLRLQMEEPHHFQYLVLLTSQGSAAVLPVPARPCPSLPAPGASALPLWPLLMWRRKPRVTEPNMQNYL